MFNFIVKIINSLRIIFHPKGGIKYFSKKNSSIASFNLTLSLSNLGISLNTIIDVGANIGQFACAVRQFYPDATIYSFEPLPECYKYMTDFFKDDKYLSVYNLALSDSKGELFFYQNNQTYASSALKISEYQKKLFPKAKEFRKIKVPCEIIDNLPLNYISPVLMKLDVQGLEKKVLQGCSKSLEKIDYIVLETSFIPMYDNEPLFEEMHQLLKMSGFEIVAPIGFLQNTNNSITPQLDILYRRSK